MKLLMFDKSFVQNETTVKIINMYQSPILNLFINAY